MPDIYDEALADRKRLLEVATTNAKNKIVDALTPRIKSLVESTLLGKLDEELGDEENILMDLDIGGDIEAQPADVIDPQGAGMPPESIEDPAINIPLDATVADPSIDVSAGENAGLSVPDQDGKTTLDVDSFLANKNPNAQFELTPESLKLLNSLISGKILESTDVSKRINFLYEKTKKLVKNTNPSIKELEEARQIKLECERLYDDLQGSHDISESAASKFESQLEKLYRTIMEHYSAAGHLKAVVTEMFRLNKLAGKYKKQLTEKVNSDQTTYIINMMKESVQLQQILQKLSQTLGKDDSVDYKTVQNVNANLASLYTEMKNMVKKGKRIDEADELDVGAEVAGGDAEDLNDDFLVQFKLPASLADLQPGDTVEVASAEPAGEESDEGMGDLDDMDLDMDSGEEPGMEGEMDADSDMDSMDDMEEGDGSEGVYESVLSDDDIIEIDEAALVQEMKKMKKLQEKKKVGTSGIKGVNTGGHGAAHFDSFGGGKDEGESFVDGEDLNASDPLGSEGYLEEGEEMLDVDEAEEQDEEEMEEGEEEVTESRKSQKVGRSNRQPKETQLAETFKKVTTELNESKLLNVKLVALNRVLQIPGLSKVQKQKIVETLDKGRTLAEVKQLYSRIVNSIRSNKKTVTESATREVKGSSSRPLTSSSPTNVDTNPLVERWQKIAFGGTIKG